RYNGSDRPVAHKVELLGASSVRRGTRAHLRFVDFRVTGIPVLAPLPLSSRLLIAVIVAIAVPFAALAYFIHDVVEKRITRDMTEFLLKNKARDVADKINLLLQERRRDLRYWSGEGTAVAALRDPESPEAHDALQRSLNRFCIDKEVYDLLLVVDRSGRIVAWNTQDAHESDLSPKVQQRLKGADVYETSWFQSAIDGTSAIVDWHLDPLQQVDVAKTTSDPADFSVGYAAPIRDPGSQEGIGVWYSLLDWSVVQEKILDPVAASFAELSTDGAYGSGYAFLWKADAKTIIGHRDRALYGKSVEEVGTNLGRLQAAVRKNPNAVVTYAYPQRTSKRAAV